MAYHIAMLCCIASHQVAAEYFVMVKQSVIYHPKFLFVHGILDYTLLLTCCNLKMQSEAIRGPAPIYSILALIAADETPITGKFDARASGVYA